MASVSVSVSGFFLISFNNKQLQCMVRKKLFLFPMLCAIIFMQSCVHGDLDVCPPMVTYAVAFTDTLHMYNGDRFSDDVKKINLYVFDDENLVYTYTTRVGTAEPFEKNFKIPLDLPMGNYHMIAWGNIFGNDSVAISPVTPHATHFDDVEVILHPNEDNVSNKDLLSVFYGEKTINIPLYTDRVDTIPLINNTNHIRVVLHWDHTDADDGARANYDNIQVRLNGTNSRFDFNDEILPNTIQYAPYVTDHSGNLLRDDAKSFQLKIYNPLPTGVVVTPSDSSVYDFKVLRLFPGNELMLTIHQTNNIGNTINLFAPVNSPLRTSPDFGVDIIGDISGTSGFSQYKKDVLNKNTREEMQESFDRYENYRVDIFLKYNKMNNTYIAIPEIVIEDWHKIIIPPIFGGAD